MVLPRIGQISDVCVCVFWHLSLEIEIGKDEK
jgi:hypothetical protein